MATLTNKEQLFNHKPELQTKRVFLEKYDLEFIVSEMGSGVRTEWELSITGRNGGQNNKNMREKLLVYSIVDEDGKLVFDAKDIPKLAKYPSKAMDKVFEAAWELNAITNEDVEELAKN